MLRTGSGSGKREDGLFGGAVAETFLEAFYVGMYTVIVFREFIVKEE